MAEQTSPQPSPVEGYATEANRLSLDGTALIGVMGPSDNQEALIRFSSGKIVKVRRGAKVSGLGVIAAIRGDRVILSDKGRTRTLAVLGG
ncbi:hypothetical protein [Anianabacter salinae]|uniref:hypothetical protein n=1 Tax=Anianabacter salinae TaxID=2851023 RepID=UPI00225DDAC1|nr:hypothetical protein [Anianabacter salinae]MBV0911472.1 hypothetical protein [Anianabacter salinae]